MRVIFDLDGTLCNIDHRLHFIKRDKPDWDAFQCACEGDIPKHDIIATLHALNEAGHDVQIWTARSVVAMTQTIAWFANTGIDHALITRMRQASNYTPDHELKEQWLLDEIANGRKPDLVFDDRQTVVDMWRRNGITCCQVDSWHESRGGDKITREDMLDEMEDAISEAFDIDTTTRIEADAALRALEEMKVIKCPS